jgi:hypothetical protein
MKKKKCINPFQITTAINTAGNLIAKDLSDDEVNFLAAAFMQLADVLATIAVVRGINSQLQEQPSSPTQEQKQPASAKP